MIVGEAPGPGNATDVYTPTLVNRVQAKSAQFVSVLEPYAGESAIASVGKTEDGRIVVKMKNGREQVFYYNAEAETAGAMQYYFVDGKEGKAARVQPVASFADGELDLSANGDGAFDSLTAVVYAPGAAKVRWNGEEIAFKSDNGFVMASVQSEDEPEPSTSPTPTPTPSFVPAPTPSPAKQAERQVQAGESASLSLGQEVVVSVPAGALDRQATYKIVKLDDASVIAELLKKGDQAASPIYEITKSESGKFLVPIKIRLTFDPAKVGEGQKASIHYYDESNKHWVEMGGTVDGSSVEVASDHLTKFAVFAVSASPSAAFADTQGHWASADIQDAVKAGIVKGYEDGTFKPNQSVTRAEFSVMLMNALQPEGQAGAEPNFADRDQLGDWAAEAVAKAVKAGILHGFEDRTLRPNAGLSRAQLAVMLAAVLDGEPATDPAASLSAAAPGFADEARIPAWASSAVRMVQTAGLMKGRAGGRFEPEGTVTRAEAATVVVRIIELMKAKALP